MTSPSYHLDDLLHAAGGLGRGSAWVDTDADAVEPTAEQWRLLEDHLQARAEALAAGTEPPAWPAPLAAAMIDVPALRTAFRTLAGSVAEAVAEARPRLAAAAATPAAAAGEAETPSLGDTVRAVLRCLADKWAAVSTHGLDVMNPQLTLARGAASAPVALQGLVGSQYLVSMSVSGNPVAGCALDLQCQEVRPGQSEPKPVPSFCLKAPDGTRFHSRDRIAHVEPLVAGRHEFQLEVTGRRRGTIVLHLEGDDAPPLN